MRLQVVFAVYLEQCSRAAINQIESLGEKRGERERERGEDDGGCGGDRDATTAAIVVVVDRAR